MTDFMNPKVAGSDFNRDRPHVETHAVPTEELSQLRQELDKMLKQGRTADVLDQPVYTVRDVLDVLKRFYRGGGGGSGGGAGTPGADGREVELQVTETHIQWRYVGEVAWTDLIALSELVGPEGDPGDPGPPGAANTIYDQAVFIGGEPPDNVLAFRNAIARNVRLATDCAGSVGFVGTNPTAAATFTLQKNGGSIGTVVISTGGVFTFTAAQTDFAAGDRLEIVTPTPADATLADVSITLVLERL